MRRFAFLFLAVAGCETLSPFASPVDNRIVPQGTISAESHAAAEKLDRVGRQILSTNPFLVSAPAFGFVGTKDPELFHQNVEAVFASEGLINQCKSDDELAALLCVELARITAESRNLARIGLAQTDTTLPGPKAEPNEEQADLGGGDAVGKTSDPSKRIQAVAATNVMAFAAELHKNAGYKPEAFSKTKTLLNQSETNAITAKQLGGTGAVPTWSR